MKLYHPEAPFLVQLRVMSFCFMVLCLLGRHFEENDLGLESYMLSAYSAAN